MHSDRFREVARLFRSAGTLPAAERAAFLDERCGDDRALRAEVESLLAAQVDTLSLQRLVEPAGDDEPPPGLDRDRIGRYRVVGVLGRGGMGIVFDAEQPEPRRRVAVKVLYRHLASDVERFRREAALLGRLEHPAIARIYEASTTDAGEPFLVMERVDGERIDRWVARHRVPTRARVQLLVRVCRAIEHAHRQRVIHLDLKPANVLIDGRGQPRVVDFGIALAIDSPPADDRPSGDRRLAGTVPYMSPEQLAGDGRALDTRTDVFGLGVLAFDVLGASTDSPADRTTPFAAHVDPGALRRLPDTGPALGAELESVVRRAVATHRDERYGSAAELADDLERWLRHEPVRAHPPTVGYRARKFARRNRLLVGTGSAVMAVLLVSLAVTTRLWVRARDAEGAERSARLDQELEAAAANEVAEILTAMLRMPSVLAPDPDPEVKVVDVLDGLRTRLELAPPTSPRVELAVRDALGGAYASLGRVEDAAAEFDRALALPDDGSESDALHRLRSRIEAAKVARRAREPGRAITLAEQAVAFAAERLGPAHPRTSLARLELVRALRDEFRGDDADRILAELVAAAREAPASDSDDFVVLQREIAASLLQKGMLGDALAVVDRTLAAAPITLARRADLLSELGQMSARLRCDRGDYDGAVTTAADLHAHLAERLGPDHDSALIALRTLGGALAQSGQFDEAMAALRQAIARGAAAPGARSRAYWGLQISLADTLLDQLRLAEATVEFERAIAGLARDFGETDLVRLETARRLALYLAFQGRLDEAREWATYVCRTWAPREIGNAMGAAENHRVLAVCLAAIGDREGAIAELKRVIELRHGSGLPTPPDCARMLRRLLRQAGRGAEADGLRLRLGPRRPGAHEFHPIQLVPMHVLTARHLLREGLLDDAAEAAAGLVAFVGDTPPTALQRHPMAPRAWLLNARIREARRDHDRIAPLVRNAWDAQRRQRRPHPEVAAEILAMAERHGVALPR